MDEATAAACPWEGRTVALILVDPTTGETWYANTVTDKRDLVAARNVEGRKLLAAWPGRWSQDVFEVDPSVVRRALGIKR